MGTLGVHIGLNSVNVTLKAMPISNQSSDIDYNKHFHWVDATQMKEGLCIRPPEGPPFPHPHCRRLHCGRQGLLLGKELPRGRLLHLNLPLDGFCSLGSLQPSPHRCPSIRRQPDDPHRVHLALLQLIYYCLLPSLPSSASSSPPLSFPSVGASDLCSLPDVSVF